MAEPLAEVKQTPTFPKIGERQALRGVTEKKEAQPRQYPIRFEVVAPVSADDAARVRQDFQQGTMPYAHMVADSKAVSERMRGNHTKVVYLNHNPHLPENADEPPAAEDVWLGLPGGPADILAPNDPDHRLLVVTSNPLGEEALANNSNLNELQRAINEQIAKDNKSGAPYNAEPAAVGLLAVAMGVAATFQNKDYHVTRRRVLQAGAAVAGATAAAMVFGRDYAPGIAAGSSTNSPVLQEAAKWLGPQFKNLLPSREFLTAMATLQSMDAHDVLAGRGLPANAPLGIMGTEHQYPGAQDLVTNEQACARVVHDYVHRLGDVVAQNFRDQGTPLTTTQRADILVDLADYLARYNISQVADPTLLQKPDGTFPDAVNSAVSTMPPMISSRVIGAIAGNN